MDLGFQCMYLCLILIMPYIWYLRGYGTMLHVKVLTPPNSPLKMMRNLKAKCEQTTYVLLYFCWAWLLLQRFELHWNQSSFLPSSNHLKFCMVITSHAKGEVWEKYIQKIWLVYLKWTTKGKVDGFSYNGNENTVRRSERQD